MDIRFLQNYYHRTEDFISVIIPCYNREKYIRQCLDSIFSQSVPKSFYEVICVDDGSQDATVSIIKEFEEKYSEHLLLIECPGNSNGYVGKVRNIGMQYASGNYLLFIDSDDFVAPDFIEKLYTGMLISNAQIVAASSYIFQGNYIYGHLHQDELIYDTTKCSHFVNLYKMQSIHCSCCGKLYSNDFLKTNQIRFREDLKISEDKHFHNTTLNYVHIYYSLPDCLYYYRQNPEGIWNSPDTYRDIWDYFQARLYMYEDYLNHFRDMLYARYHQYFDDIYVWETASSVLNIKNKCSEFDRQDYFYELWPAMKEKLDFYFPDLKEHPFIRDNKEMQDLLFLR